MLQALLLAVCFGRAAQEWVEISQTHYRKPAKIEEFLNPAETTGENTRPNIYSTHEEDERNRPNLKRPFDEEGEFAKFSDRTAYPNRSITEHKWHQDEYRPGNIKRVNNGGKPKANITPEFSIEVFGEVTEQIPEFVTVIQHNRKNQQAVSATIEKVPNKGSVKRVQLANTPVKSPSIEQVKPIRRNDVNHGLTSMDSDEFEIKPLIFKDNRNNVDLTTNVRRVFITTTDTPWKNEHSTPAWPVSESTVTFQRHPQTIATENKRPRNNTNEAKINVYHYPTNTNKTITEDNMTTKDLEIESTNVTSQDKKILQNRTRVTNTNIIKAEDLKEEEKVTPDTKKLHINNNGNEFKHDKQHIIKPNGVKSEIDNKIVTNEGIKVNTMENVMKFLKVVTDTISKNTRRGVNGKVKYLNELKDTLLNSIKERIDTTWPDEVPGGRHSRSAEARGHVEFPSSESSLMTISFLTFAVFLIKLVLQVIQTYKHKTMMVAPLVVATARKLRNT